MHHNIPVVILCGGMGTRLREETEYKPKPMVEIGGKPILWHIMKHYASTVSTDSNSLRFLRDGIIIMDERYYFYQDW